MHRYGFIANGPRRPIISEVKWQRKPARVGDSKSWEIGETVLQKSLKFGSCTVTKLEIKIPKDNVTSHY